MKNHASTYIRLERQAEKYYNQSMLAECDTETVVKTHIQLGMQRLVLARIGSGKYGIKGVHFSEATMFREDNNHHLVVASEEEKVPLYRNAAVLRQITMALTRGCDRWGLRGGPSSLSSGWPLWQDQRGDS